MAERDLARLVAGLAPVVRPSPYVVVETDADVPAAAIIVENESTTKVVERATADAHGLPYTFVAAWITCTIESDLHVRTLFPPVELTIHRWQGRRAALGSRSCGTFGAVSSVPTGDR